MSPLVRPALAATALLISALTVTAGSTNSSWSVHVWQSDDGLPNNDVTSLAQTPDGYLWLATPGKLARFDGVRFEGFSPKSIVPQFDRKITTLLPTRAGLWLGMEHGPVLLLNSGVTQVITNGLPDMVVEAMAEDAEGSVWILAHRAPGAILCRVRDGSITLIQTAGGSRSLTRDNHGRIWFINDGRFGEFEGTQFHIRTQLPPRAAHLAAASDGSIWICCGPQLFKYDGVHGLKELGTFEPGDTTARPTALLEDHSGEIWIGTSDSGLFRSAGDHFESVPISHSGILSLLEDRERNIWVGTAGGGLDRIQPRAIELEGVGTGLPFDSVQSLCEDGHGVLWAATQDGLLARRQNGIWKTVATNAEWPGDKVNCVTVDNSGTVWIGTQARKLVSLGDGHFKTWDALNGLVCRNIHSLLTTMTGDVWIAGNNPDTLERLRGGVLRSFELPPEVHVLRAMAEDAAGNVWVGSAKGTLLRVTGEQVFDESVRISGLQWSIRSLYASPDGSLWIGYSGWGLGRLNDGHFSHVIAAQGLYDDQISQVIADNAGWLWLGADSGIFKIRPEEFEDVAAGRTARLHSIHYGKNDGLPSLQANFGATPGALRSHDGRLWIPMRTALAVITPDRSRDDREPPSVLLTRVVADDQVVAAYGGGVPLRTVADLRKAQIKLRFPPDHRRLEFDFTAPGLASPENVDFQYRLDGFDDRWTDAGPQRSVSYSRLPEGKYRFLVRACNADGVWNETGTALAFAVDPFLWHTWWFRLIVIVGFTTAVIAIARYLSFRRLRSRLQMVEQQAALDRERARIARDIHDDLGCRLTKIVLLTEVSLRNSEKGNDAIDRVKQISATAREGMQSLDETVWAINPRNDTLADLVDYMGQFALDFLQAAGIRCHLDLPDHPLERTLSSEVRHSLFLVVKEALNNIVRHSDAREVHLRVTASDGSLQIIVSDNGRGFSEVSPNGCADGLRNMRHRMEELSGQCRIESKPGTGTTISFVQPWRNGH
jgi:signal transduction histidine kinase/ligand-binding sensor domain-containing protein